MCLLGKKRDDQHFYNCMCSNHNSCIFWIEYWVTLCDTSINTELGTTIGDADGQWLLWIYKAWINYELLSASMTTPLTIRSPPSLYSTYTAMEGVSV